MSDVDGATSQPADSSEATGDAPEHGVRHLAIIMDGNGRWAKARRLPRAAGHREGVEALRKTVDAAHEFGIEHLTVFSFSTENWSRPPAEVEALFGLLKLYVHKDLKRLHAEGVRIRIFGSRDRLGQDILDLIEECESRTKFNTAFNLNIAFNYGSRAEFVEAAKRFANEVVAGRMQPEDLNQETFVRFMWSGDLPDTDLLLRTSGELRISNFLLWHIAYSELLFMDVLWPDFDRSHLEQALDAFRSRDRRFGGVASN